MIKEIPFKTEQSHCWRNFLVDVQTIVAESGVQEGMCYVFNPHTTAGLFITSYLDPLTPEDVMREWQRLVPIRDDFLHQLDGKTDAAGHIKSTMMGSSLTMIVHEGRLMLGSSQGILFAEFDGPRDRKLIVKVISD